MPRNRFDVNLINFQDLYRILLKAESEGILDDVDMTQVEKLILDPEDPDTKKDWVTSNFYCQLFHV